MPHFFTIGEDGRIEITDQVPGATVAEADKDYIILYYPEYIESATADDAGEKPLFIDLTTDAEGNWTITVSDALVVGEDGALVRTTDAENPNTFTLKIDTEAPDFAQAESLTVQYGDGAKIEISGALLDQIQQEGNGKMLLSIKPADTEGRTFDSVEGSVIPFVNAPAKEIYDLELLIKVYDDQPNSGEKIADFEGGMAITVKPTVIMVLKETGGWKTNAYILEGTTATADDLQVAVSEADGTVTFRPPHFTEVVLVNEYFLDLFFEGSTEEGAYTINGKTVNAAGGYVPEGATLKAVTPSLSEAADEHNLIDTMTFGEEEAEIGGDFILGSAPVALTTYTIAKDAPVTFGGEEVEAPIGSVLPYEISLKPGEKLSALPEGATLLEIIEKPDGSKVYVFAVTVTPALPPITYQIEQITTNEYYITNGIAGDRQEGVTYKSTKDTTFSTGTYFLDLRTEEKGGASLLLLWIVLIVLLVAAIIAMLYLIIIKKGLGPNLFTKIITGIVKAFFLVCLGAYMIFSFKIFRKAK